MQCHVMSCSVVMSHYVMQCQGDKESVQEVHATQTTHEVGAGVSSTNSTWPAM